MQADILGFLVGRIERTNAVAADQLFGCISQVILSDQHPHKLDMQDRMVGVQIMQDGTALMLS